MQVRLGIELLDGGRPVGRFAVPSEISNGPFTIGTEGQVVLPGAGVLPVHGVMLFQGGKLFCASASTDAPIRAGNQMIPTEWVEVPLPCVLRVGPRLCVRPFAYKADSRRSSVATPPPQPLPTAPPDATRVGAAPARPAPMERDATPAARLAAARAARAAVGQPGRQAKLKAKTGAVPRGAVGEDTLMEKAKARLASDWKRTSVLMKAAVAALPVVAILLLVKPSNATGNPNDSLNQPVGEAVMEQAMGSAAPMAANAMMAQAPMGAPGGAGAMVTQPPTAIGQAAAPQVPGAPQGGAAAAPTVAQAAFGALAQQAAAQPGTGQPGFGTSNGRTVLLTPAERQARKRAVDFTFAGDYGAALQIYESLAAAHPDDLELRTATQVLAAKAGKR